MIDDDVIEGYRANTRHVTLAAGARLTCNGTQLIR
jgi:hypothetical protein